MSKKIAIIHDDFHPLIVKIKEILEGWGCEVDFVPWFDLSWNLGQEKKALFKYDSVYLDRMGEKSASYATQLALMAEVEKLPGSPKITNSVQCYWNARNKALMALQFQKAGIPTAKTLVAYTVEQVKDFVASSNSEKFIAKSILGCCANDVHFFLKNEIPVVATDILTRDGILIVQNFIFNPERYIWRVDVVNGEVIVANQRYAFNQNPEFPISNGSIGGEIKFWKPKDLPFDVSTLALRAAESLGLKVAGVDLLLDVNGRLYVGEVNPEPDITQDKYEFPTAIANYLRNI